MFSLLTQTPLLAAQAQGSVVVHYVPDWAKGNIVLEYFFKGGVVMYPILAVLVVAIAIILERAVWWAIHAVRKDPNKLDKMYAALEQGNLAAAANLGRKSGDPLIRTVWHGINHVHSSIEGALQVASGVEIQRAGRVMWILDSVITLAPLLGLLGTVTGIMLAFNAVNEGGLSPAAVSGGIGEALIATMCGLGIAITTLIFFNFYNAKLAKLQFELESTCNNVLIMFNTLRLKNPNIDVVQDARESQQFASSN
jgi:biopolymer transport protein ExbB